jgi:hypothetical protein
MRTRCRWCANSEPCPSNTGLRPSCRHPVGQLLLQASQAFPGGGDQLLQGWRRVLFHLLVGEPVKNSSTRSRTVSRCHNARRPRAGTKASSSRLETPQPRGVHRPRHQVGQRHPAEGGIVVLHPLSHAGIRSSFGTPASGDEAELPRLELAQRGQDRSIAIEIKDTKSTLAPGETMEVKVGKWRGACRSWP